MLKAVRQASDAGVAFPFSPTHYIETNKITNLRQSAELARTMASISRCRTLRSACVLLRRQMLHARNCARVQARELCHEHIRLFGGLPA